VRTLAANAISHKWPKIGHFPRLRSAPFASSQSVLCPQCVPNDPGTQPPRSSKVMSTALTDTLIRSIPPPAQGRTEIADLKATGLAFRVTSTGLRSWCFRFRDPKSGKTSRATIGPYPTVSLSVARQRAETMRAQVTGGENPVELRRRERRAAATRTFQALADRYLNEHARRHNRR
jgi:hypothetical protein